LPSLSSTLFYLAYVSTNTDIRTLSLHDALPISLPGRISVIPSISGYNLNAGVDPTLRCSIEIPWDSHNAALSLIIRTSSAAIFSDRKSTRLNSSHVSISYAVFCLKKKKQDRTNV